MKMLENKFKKEGEQMDLGDLSEDDLQMMEEEEAGPSCYGKTANEVAPGDIEKHGPKFQ